MEKFVSYEKLSKKKQKKLNAAKRGNWGLVKPVTKVKPSAKLYNRKKKDQMDCDGRHDLFWFFNYCWGF